MLPQALKDLLASPAMAQIASRNSALRPSIHRCHGFRLLDDTRVEAFVRNVGGLAENVADHPLVALNVLHPVTNVAFQIKGPCQRLSEPTAEHQALFEQFAVQAIDLLAGLGYPRELGQKWVQPPKLIAEISIAEAYVQTPGPGAGKRVLPAEAS